MGLAADVYAEQLLSKAHGLPLWIPEPSKFGEVLIGDVGYVYSGSFYRLFNVIHPKDHPANDGGVPDGFQVLDLDPRLLHRVDQYLDAGAICSKSVKRVDVSASGSSNTINAGIGYRFSCAQDQGALLILKAPASQEVVHPNRMFRDYMRAHHDSWCDFARARGLDIDPDHIILVRGWVKTTEWAVAAFTDSGSNHEVHFDAQAGPFAKASFSVSYSSAVSMSVEHRTCPVRSPQSLYNSEVGDGLPQDQCVFLSYYEMRTRGFWAKKKIRAAAEPRDFDGNAPESDEVAESDSSDTRSNDSWYVEEDRPPPKFVDSVSPLLDYILQNSDATAAIASDDDVRRVMPGESWPEDVAKFLQESRPHVCVDSGSTGYLVFDESSSPENNLDPASETHIDDNKLNGVTEHDATGLLDSSSIEQMSSFPFHYQHPNEQRDNHNPPSPLDSHQLNAIVMPTPLGKGGDPAREDEEQMQKPISLTEPSASPPSTPSQPSRVRLRGSMYIPGWSIPPKVLVVDDDAVCRKLSSKFLRVFGCFSDIAVDGIGAVNKMNLGKYDLVFMDIMMPKLDGVSATSLIRQFDHMTPIISMTSNSQPNEVVKYYSSGMNDILPKPFTKDDLLQKLEKHLMHLKGEELRRLSHSPSGSSPVADNFDQVSPDQQIPSVAKDVGKRLQEDAPSRRAKRHKVGTLS